MGLYVQGGKKVGGMYMADGKGNYKKIGGMYWSDGKGQTQKIYSSFLPVGQSLYSIPTGYNGFFLSGNSGVTDINDDVNDFKSIAGASTVQLTQSIDKCKNGVQVNVFQQGLFQYTAYDKYQALYNPNPPFSAKSILIPKGSLTGSISFGISSVQDSPLVHGSIKASGAILQFTTGGNNFMGQLDNDNEWKFWAITSIVSY